MIVRLLGGGLLFAALLLPIPSSDPTVPRWIALALLALLIPARVPHALLWGLPLLGWAALSLLWTPDWLAGLDSLWRWCVAFGVLWALWGLRLPAHWIALAAGIVAVALIPAFMPYQFGGMGNENWQAEFLVICSAWLLAFGRPMFLPMLLVLVGIWWLTGSNAVALALGLDLALLSVWLLRKREWSGAAIVACVLVLGLMAATGPDLRASIGYRAELWINTAALWLENPIFGTGLGSFTYLYPGVQEAHLGWLPQHGTLLVNAAVYAGAAHNDPLELLALLGLVGVGLLGLWGWKAAPVLNSAPAPRLALWHALAVSLVGFPLQNPMTIALVCLALAELLKDAPAIALNWRIRLLPAPVFGACLYAVALFWSADLHFGMALAHHSTDKSPHPALGEALRAADLYPLSPRFRQQPMLSLRATLMYSLMTPGVKVEISNSAADRIYRVARSAGPMPAIEIARLQYLLGTRRNRPEAERLVAELKSTASQQVEAQTVIQVAERMGL